MARRRTFVIRVGLVFASVALLAAAAASARGLDVRERGFLPRGSTGVVVLDLSLSISDTCLKCTAGGPAPHPR